VIPQETVNQITETARIEEVVGDFVSLKRRGSDFVACCPFHNEKTPSFHVSPSRGIYKCFGCGKAGSSVNFLMEYEHLTYVEALRYLAKKYHIEIQEREETAEDIARRQRSESLHLAAEFAQKFFVESLQKDEGRAIGLQYFHSRGLEDATILKYGLGWSPRARNSLLDAARAAGYKDEYMVGAGVVIQREDGTLSDRFWDRVMFPFHTVSGRVVGFGGRTLKKDHGGMKYVNSPESELYVKNQILYGLYFAKNEISRTGKCYLVEGYLDVLSMHQLGITNVVASSGTSLTDGQVSLLKRFTENVTIMYDGDSAGIHAALRGINMILREGMNVKIVLLPDGDDPDSFAQKHTLEEVQDFIAEHEQDFIGFKCDLLLEDAAGDPLKKADLINDIADTVAEIPDPIKRSTYTEAVSAKFRVDPDLILARIGATRRSRQKPSPGQSRTETPAPGPETVPQTEPDQPRALRDENEILAPGERELLAFILREGSEPLVFPTDSEFYSPDGVPTVAEFIDDALASDDVRFSNSAYRETYEAYFTHYDAGEDQKTIILRLLSGENQQVARVTADLSVEKFQITVRDFEKSLMAKGSWLASYVPRAILAYQDKRVEARLSTLRRELMTATGEDQIRILDEIGKANTLKRRIKIKLGREK
jgi:DNA primase